MSQFHLAIKCKNFAFIHIKLDKLIIKQINFSKRLNSEFPTVADRISGISFL